MFYSWKPYVRVADRRKKAARALAKLAKKGHHASPVVIKGRTIAHTVWGKAWCENLERYSDYSNRLPRGRTYARNGSVVDLQVAPGGVIARVAGSSMYRVGVAVAAMPQTRWAALCGECAGGIDSLVELLQGRVAKSVLERMCRPESGLFPKPSELQFDCSCPDWAQMCKHVAAALYGIGARLDEQPELLFRLRKVDEHDLIARVSRGAKLARPRVNTRKLLDAKLANELFNIELAEPERPRGKRVAAAQVRKPVKRGKAAGR